MPTFNQLVKKGRQTSVFVQLLRLLHLRNLTQLLERSPEYVCLTESK